MGNKIIDFLSELKQNNNREWFAENKSRYLEAKRLFENLIYELLPHMVMSNPRLKGLEVKDTVFRIYRDVRFSKDKSPYKTQMGAYMSAGGRKSIYAGYYLHCEPDNSFLGGGIYRPQGDVLKKIRSEIYYNIDEFKNIISHDTFLQTFKQIYGDKLVRPPVGFPKDFEDLDLLKFKDYTAIKPVNNDFFEDKNFTKNAIDIFNALKPFNDFLNRALD